MSSGGGLVFGYGSLTAAPGAVAAVLPGWRRVWGVAMDNRVELAGYKRYLDAEGGTPAVCVAFLDLVAAEGCEVDGVLLEVDDAALAALDARERNYERVAVSPVLGRGGERLDHGRPVWAYVGRADARERCAAARAAGTLVVQRAYLDAVRASFAALGPGALARFDAATDPPSCAIADLERVDLPA